MVSLDIHRQTNLHFNGKTDDVNNFKHSDEEQEIILKETSNFFKDHKDNTGLNQEEFISFFRGVEVNLANASSKLITELVDKPLEEWTYSDAFSHTEYKEGSTNLYSK